MFCIDLPKDVINVSKKYLPGMAKGFFSPKLTLNVGDGFEFMKQNQDAFDVIITDSSDPVGKYVIDHDQCALSSHACFNWCMYLLWFDICLFLCHRPG